MDKPEFFSRDMYLAWLLRRDVQSRLIETAGSETEAAKEFVVWWHTFGRKEFPFVAPPSRAQIEVAGEVVHGAHGLTRLMRGVYRSRQDVQDVYNVATEAGYAGFFRWFYLYGVAEFDLHTLLTQPEMEYLRAPAEGYQLDSEPTLTRLMHLTWLVRADLRDAFNLAERESREGYIAWFYVHGVKEFGLQAYLHPADVALLYGPDPRFAGVSEAPVSRLMWFYRMAEQGSCEELDMRTVAGRSALKAQVDARLCAEAGLRGIHQVLHSRSRPLRYLAQCDSEEVMGPGSAWSKRKLAQAKNGPFGVNLVGYGLGELGIGEDVRMMVRSLESAGVEFCVLNRQPGSEIRQMDLSIARHFEVAPRYPVTIVCMTAFDTASLWLDAPELFKTTYVIGFWPWELPDWPREWDGVYDLVDEIWSSSQYTYQAFSRRAQVPVLHMPMTVTVEAMAEYGRKELGLPEDRFLFLFVFDFMSYPARKNPHACIRAFRQAFPQGGENVGLVLKISNVMKTSPQWEELLSMFEADHRILVIDHTIDRGAVLALMNRCDAYVSLHRSEGFGRTLAEALLLEKPVVTTGYSGNVDFVDETTGYPVDYRLIGIAEDEYPCGSGMEWADPDVSQAAERMREIYQNRDEALLRASRGRRKVASEYSAVAVGERTRKRLMQLFDKAVE